MLISRFSNPANLSTATQALAASIVTAAPPATPPGLGTPARNSASYFTTADTHSITVKSGGTLSDLWLTQKNSPTGFTNAKEFYAAVLVSNPSITDVNSIRAGQTLYLPQKLADSSITYHYANGASINTNAATGEYFMNVPNGEGGRTIYSSTYVGDIDGPDGIDGRRVDALEALLGRHFVQAGTTTDDVASGGVESRRWRDGGTAVNNDAWRRAA